MKGYLTDLYNTVPFLQSLPIELIYLFGMIVVCVCIVIFVAMFAGICTYLERKVAGHIQHRVGPYRVGPHGVLQWIADALKLILKEDIIPGASDRLLFKMAPFIVFGLSFAAFVALPYSIGFSPGRLNIGIFYIMAVTSVVVVGLLMAGWSSGNKWALFGSMRSAAQIVSYEIPMGITLLGMLLLVGSLDMHRIVEAQRCGMSFNLSGHDAGVLSWFIFRHPPFTIFAFLVYFTAVLAETNRIPFDIPEAESELVAGYHTEYSGMRFAFFFLAEYANMLVVSAIATTIFLGGWLPPFGRIFGDWIFLGEWLGIPLLTFVEGLFWFLGKSFVLVFIMMWLRWTLPRYRVDQLMQLCWVRLVPLAFLNLFAIGIAEAISGG
jgi:NADH-quinone oxidoreductase subunit H